MNSTKIIATVLFLLASILPLHAHNMWIELNVHGEINQPQKVVVHYGEYSYGYYESTNEGFKEVQDFSLWLITPDGNKKNLNLQRKQKSYQAEFIPNKKGRYSVILRSVQAEVVDWREYDLGIVKPNFYATATTIVGNSTSPVGNNNAVEQQLEEINPLVIYPVGYGKGNSYPINNEGQISLKISYEGEPLAEHEVVIGISGQWTKSVYTDVNGVASFKLPWNRQYVMETVYTEEQPGSFNGKPYEVVRHTASYTLKRSS